MIDNYLDWVKRQRKYAIQHALLNERRSKTFNDLWAKGFYKGLGMASYAEAYRWRKLQKDIEARVKRGGLIAEVDCQSRRVYKELW